MIKLGFVSIYLMLVVVVYLILGRDDEEIPRWWYPFTVFAWITSIVTFLTMLVK